MSTVTTGGRIFIESKWFWQGTFLHAPQSQYFSDDITYYRSARRGHLLLGLDPSEPPADSKEDPSLGWDEFRAESQLSFE